jgi:hypothetical protein
VQHRTGKLDLDDRRGRCRRWHSLGDNRHKACGRPSRRRTQHLRNIATCRTPPHNDLLRTHLTAARTSDTRVPGTSVSSTIRAFSSADQRRRRPRSRQYFDPSESALRAVINVEHSDSSKPLASGQTSHATPGMEEGRWSTAYRAVQTLLRLGGAAGVVPNRCRAPSCLLEQNWHSGLAAS